MDSQTKIIKDLQVETPEKVKLLTVLVLAGLINPKFKYLHWKMINKVGMTNYLDFWIYALTTAKIPELAVIALCKKVAK